ncbi:HD domain-containing protein [Hahella sp. KA22]|uniref:HD domain-containing phosphohydrolase n=1 Tax=Hahella sp. KA22 TaxID=1628392 RepID=UPI000FDEE95A|nr:HD domain-containing phosphohydrolase [Hahella sp. KA22]AZZ90202.1 HD domain-containing protein [Hahella sp. KA22]QAY53572.1 HD domain-containing protein [Hahella sp. KA22]
MKPITCPQFVELEKDLIDEFVACFQENVEEIEHTIQTLEHQVNPDLINELFRSMHSLKGNCRMVFLDAMVDVIHELEEIVSDMRKGELPYQPMFGVFFMSIIGYVETLVGQLASDHTADGDLQESLLKVIAKVRNASPGNVIAVINEGLDELLSGPKDAGEAPRPEAAMPSYFAPGKDSDQQLFRFLARQLDQLSIYRKDRTQKELELCTAINAELGGPINEEQLSAAVLLHDLGMAFVPVGLAHKHEEQLSREEQKIMAAHVATSSQILHRFGGWEDAAQIVLHHHEHYDGSGYPFGVSGKEIPMGSKVLAICDAFFEITSEREDRSYKKSLFEAVRYVNSYNGSLFDPDCVEAFNMAVRKLYIAKES